MTIIIFTSLQGLQSRPWNLKTDNFALGNKRAGGYPEPFIPAHLTSPQKAESASDRITSTEFFNLLIFLVSADFTILTRNKRIALGGYVYHVISRANGRLRIFRKDDDFLAFEKILSQAIERYSMRLCGYCLMENHWHLLLWPINDSYLSKFMRWVTLTHTQRYHASHGTIGIGHIYQGRFKSFPVQDDNHYYTVLRYIEANPLRAKIVKQADDWRWSSFAIRHGAESLINLSDGPIKLPRQWSKLVNKTADPQKLSDLEKSFKRGTPFGNPAWQTITAGKLALESTMRPRGRPNKSTNK